MQFGLDKQTEKTLSTLAVRVQKLLIITSVLVSVSSTLMPVHGLPLDGSQQKSERNINEYNELHIWWLWYRTMVHLSVDHRWHTPPDVHLSVRRLMGHLSVSHRWHTPPDGSSKCEPPMAHTARWVI
ncbi:hypothetical protein AVEN_5692-1 [Araneus ventricosus]|uniref:Uncharacterized protein n=1 Tax=Araneus ventricosus TaxID=182803 RepID=A0A4Y2DWI3_ARAVE|nr:hypothetical protein AVEN_5692-1 [Araneus ventricosus]